MLEYLTSTPLGVLSERHAIEDAVILRLAGLTVELGGYLRHLGPYNGDDAAQAEQDFYRHLLTRAPAILVTTGTSQTRHRSVRMTDDEDDITIEVLAVSAHWRDLTARTRTSPDGGDVAIRDPGVYHMLRAARKLLMGRPTGIAGAKAIKHSGEAPLVQERGLCAWRAMYTISVHIEQTLAEVERDEWDALLLRGILAEPTPRRVSESDPSAP